MTTTLCRIDSDSISALLEMIWQKAPLFMRTGALVSTQSERVNKYLTPVQRNAMRNQYLRQRREGRHDMHAIAKAFGVSYNCVVRNTRDLRGVVKSKTWKRARDRGQRCREMSAQGRTHAEIAAELGCARCTVTYYLKGWKKGAP